MERPRPDANRCFVCGPDNPLGLRLRFRLDPDDTCRTEFTPGPDHGGWDRLTHGGILYSALDDVMANWLFLKGLRAYTARCEVRYRQPHRLGEPLYLVGRLVQRRGRVALMAGEARRVADDVVVAEAEASFMLAAASPPPSA